MYGTTFKGFSTWDSQLLLLFPPLSERSPQSYPSIAGKKEALKYFFLPHQNSLEHMCMHTHTEICVKVLILKTLCRQQLAI